MTLTPYGNLALHEYCHNEPNQCETDDLCNHIACDVVARKIVPIPGLKIGRHGGKHTKHDYESRALTVCSPHSGIRSNHAASKPSRRFIAPSRASAAPKWNAPEGGS